MSRRDTLLLRATALWTFFIWAVFVRNLAKDDTHGAAFKAVHLTLAVVSVALGVAIWRVATRARNSRRANERAGTPS
jgi:hypothetical protein